MTRKKKTAKSQRLRPRAKADPLRLTFHGHLLELRQRLFFVVVSVGIFSTIAYFFQHQIVNWLLAPAGNQQFIYTSVGGGIDFLFRVCLYTGIIFSIPVIIYQILRYIQPLIGKQSLRFIVFGSLASGVLAIAGILFGYYLGLPAALGFLLNQFESGDISALITVQSYLSFVMFYLVGSSLLFQVPLVIYFINRIKPLSLRSLFRKERWVILISFIVAALVNPSPRAQDMAILAIPMILSYQLGIFIVWQVNRRRTRPASITKLMAKDSTVQQQRGQRLGINNTASLSPSAKPSGRVSDVSTVTVSPVSDPAAGTNL